MPWKVSEPMSERMKFVSRLLAGERMTDLCSEFEISRKTGYKLLARYEAMGPQGLYDVSRRPKRLARMTAEPIRELLVETRRKHPTWGPRKIRAFLVAKSPEIHLPSASAIGELYERCGLVKKRKRVVRITPYGDELSQAQAANDTWCVDYKGQFRLGNGRYCYPLTVTDQFSRYLLACEGFERIESDAARAVFEELFDQHGMPSFVRSDNGAPFAAPRALFGLSRLSAFWLKYGITPERIEPAHPEQNGRHERMHRTLKAETTRPAKNNLLAQQERFDSFKKEFNQMRPHEALQNKTPAQVYSNAAKRQNADQTKEYPLHDDVLTVKSSGHVNVLRKRKGCVFVSTALAGERIGIREQSDGRLLLTFAKLDLGYYDPRQGKFMPSES